MAAILRISDGTTEINLLNGEDGFYLDRWRPAIAQWKGGGTFQSSPLSDGRRLVTRQFGNAIETIQLKITEPDQDGVIFDTQELRRLLEKAADYWATDWQSDPVWIEAQATCETNLRFALIQGWSTPDDENPYSQPFLQMGGGAVMDRWTLIIERGHWLADQPGTETATAISAVEAYDGRNLGNVDSTGTRDPTTSNEVYVANKRNEANLTDIYSDDGGVFSANLMDAALPFAFLPAVPAVNDAVYFGIDTAIANSGPFASLVFDISIAQVDLTTIVWEYFNGAWVSLTVLDNTNADGLLTGDPFDTAGVNSVHWEQQSDWTATAINGITAFWVRARVTVIGGAPAPPTQQNRDIYTITWPYVEIQSAQVGGDLPALSEINFFGQSSDTSVLATSMASYLFVGLRSVSRGEDFSAYLNAADEQNLAGMTVTTGANTSFVDNLTAPTGRVARFNPAGLSAIGTRVLFTFSDALADQYRGRFRLYLRVAASGVTTTFTVQYQILTSASPTTSDTLTVQGAGDEYLDFGPVVLPPAFDQNVPTDLGSFLIRIRVSSSDGTDDLDIKDMILMPIDEWSAFASTPLETSAALGISNLTYLDMGSIDPTGVYMRSVIKAVSDDLIDATYRTITNGKMIAQANARQRFWFFAPRLVTLTTPTASFYFAASVQMFRNQQYLSMRGAR